MKAGRASGFSLMEIMVALCVVVIVAGISVVSLNPAWQKRRLGFATEELRQRFQTLRLKSIMAKRDHQAIIQDKYVFFRHRENEDWSDWEKTALNPTIKYSMKGTESFYSKGFASPKTITLTNGEYSQKIIININGRIRVSEIF